MQERWTEQLVIDENPASDDDGDRAFCPECGQSLDVARHQATPVKRRTLESFVFLIFGLCLVIAFALRIWNTHTQLSSRDQQIAVLRTHALAPQGSLPKPGNPSMIVSDTMGEVLEEQLDLRLSFQSDITGLGLGLLTLIVAAVSWLHEHPEVADGQRRRMRSQRLRSSDRSQVGGIPWELGGLVAITLVRMALLLFVTIIGAHVIRGTPPSLQLLDQALTRIVALILTIAGFVS
jgi:hypothetical protein